MRRAANWIPMGLAYAFLYMGRYNLTVAKGALGDLMTKADFGYIFGVGAAVYGVSFLVNGPLIDRVGGRRGMLIGVFGALCANLLMGLVLYGRVNWGWDVPIFTSFLVLFAANMYFQSFGAVSIVTVKAPWFHVSERGTFSTIFGIIISAGIYFAFDWGFAIVDATRATPPEELSAISRMFAAIFGLGHSGVDENWMVFFIPSLMMGAMWLIMLAMLRNTPGEAGYEDFDTGEAHLSEDGERLPVKVAIRKILTHPVLMWVCMIEFCSGVLRNGVMHWYPLFAKEVGFAKEFWISKNWGLSLLIAGVIGANATGWVSDKLFNSRRAPMSGISYAIMIAGALMLVFAVPHTMSGANLDTTMLWVGGFGCLALSAAVIAVHGILSGTATADFGGRKNTGIVVGIVDGIVYAGTAVQSFALGWITPSGAAKADPSNWNWWPLFLVPFGIAGFFFTLRIWNALPSKARKR